MARSRPMMAGLSVVVAALVLAGCGRSATEGGRSPAPATTTASPARHVAPSTTPVGSPGADSSDPTTPSQDELDYQNAGSETIAKVARELHISTDNFAFEWHPSRMVGYYTLDNQRGPMAAAGITPMKVQYSAETLEKMADTVMTKVSTDTTGLHSVSVDVGAQRVVVAGTAGFFASPEWRRAAAGVPIRVQVEDASDAPSVAAGEVAGRRHSGAFHAHAAWPYSSGGEG
ncbi:hypothetical protein ATK17_1938 [Branchiibius hedensis]|uniref:Lipoprotein n=1 Tax=Branchiibius hedensis TaxID=672460 RepID=A0A2Y9C1N0_9MICO|nr:hypothetical protein [Branchiibius hedensis]PWJ25800.1 hypothetical protein ATK17_1938 [Branchiibius hedensis]SSA34613.1 hypothetical protein SAMN04489750_1938 [Branchiibius hedensis]